MSTTNTRNEDLTSEKSKESIAVATQPLTKQNAESVKASSLSASATISPNSSPVNPSATAIDESSSNLVEQPGLVAMDEEMADAAENEDVNNAAAVAAAGDDNEKKEESMSKQAAVEKKGRKRSADVKKNKKQASPAASSSASAAPAAASGTKKKRKAKSPAVAAAASAIAAAAAAVVSNASSSRRDLVAQILPPGSDNICADARASALRAIDSVNAGQSPLVLDDLKQVVLDRPITCETVCGTGATVLLYRRNLKAEAKIYVRIIASPDFESCKNKCATNGICRYHLLERSKNHVITLHNLTDEALRKIKYLELSSKSSPDAAVADKTATSSATASKNVIAVKKEKKRSSEAEEEEEEAEPVRKRVKKSAAASKSSSTAVSPSALVAVRLEIALKELQTLKTENASLREQLEESKVELAHAQGRVEGWKATEEAHKQLIKTNEELIKKIEELMKNKAIEN